MKTTRPKAKKMASFNDRLSASSKKFVLGVILMLLVIYSSVNWGGSIFDSGNKSGENNHRHNATSSAAARHARVRDDAARNVEPNASFKPATMTRSPAVPATNRNNMMHSTTNSTKVASNGSGNNGGSKNTAYIQLPFPNASAPPVSFTGCCGIGHRLARNIATMVYAVGHRRPLHAHWNQDVAWSVLFNDTAHVKQGPAAAENYMNYPSDWNASPLARHDPVAPQGRRTAYHLYGKDVQMMFEMPLAQSIVKHLSENLSPLVLSFLDPMRAQYADSDLHLCVHVREGNNETGDWQKKQWRHIDLTAVLNLTLGSMRNLTNDREDAEKVSLFVASDTTKARAWFEENAPPEWHVVKPPKEVPRPDAGVWFGEYLSATNSILSRDRLNEAMAEAVADVFALGECDALFVPNYSSFSIVGIMLARAERKEVLFHRFREYIRYPE